MAKRRQVFEPVSTPLEDDIPVNYRLIGTQKWFDEAFEEGAYDLSQILVVSDSSDLAEEKEWMLRQRALGVDTETTGRLVKGNKGYSMNPVNEDTRLVLGQIGTEDRVLVIDPLLIHEFKEPLESSKILKLLQNALYDFKWLLQKLGIHMERMYDTMLAEQILTAGYLGVRVGLTDITRKYAPHYLISKAVRSLFVELNGGRMTREMVYYSARDVTLLFSPFREQAKMLKELNLMKTAQTEFNCIPCTAEMELGGVYLKEDKLNLLITYWLEKQQDMGEEILKLFGQEMKNKGLGNIGFIPEMAEVFDLNSGAQKLEALRTLGFELDDTKRETLLGLDHPLAQLLGEYSNVTKWTSTYGENMREKINSFTGMWHPRFAQMGSGEAEGRDAGRDTTTTTATGRYSSDAQQFPRKMERYAREKDQLLVGRVVDRFADLITSKRMELEKAA